MSTFGTGAENNKTMIGEKVMKIKFVSLLLLLLLLSCTFFLAACSDGENASTGISSAEVKDGNVTLKATLDTSYTEAHSGGKLYILALTSIDPEGATDAAIPVAESKIKSKMTFKFSLYDDNGASRIACAFVLAEKSGESYSALTDPYYISNPESVASKNSNGNSADGIKGFSTEDVYGSRLVGADRVLFEARMDRFVLEDFEKGAVRFDLDGVSYYYDADEVERLDRLCADADAVGMRIYLRTTLGKKQAEDWDDDTLSFLYCKGSSGDAEGYLPDLSNERAVRYVKAFYAFLASRYDVSEFLIGERVNNYSKYCNAGSLTSDEFEAMYSFWARLAYQMLRSVNSSASVVIPVDDAWRIDATSGRLGAKIFLTRFADSAKKSGDYGYLAAVNLCEANDISSLLSQKESDLSDIGAENLSDVVKFIETADMRYKGERRSVMIDGLTLPTDKFNEIESAAYYTAVYYAAAASGFDAFFCSSSPCLDGENKNEFYYATVMCGTDLNSQLSQYTDVIKKISIPDFDDYVTDKLTYAQSASRDVDDSVKKNRGELELDVSMLTVGGGAYDIQGKLSDTSDVKQVSLLIRSDSSVGMAAVTAVDIPAKDVIDSGYIALTMSSPDASAAAVIISANGRTFIGETEITSSSDTYYFDILGFTENADESDSLTVTVCFISEKEGEVEAEISEIFLCGSSGNGFEAIITVIIVVIVILLLIGLIVLLVFRRKKNARAKDSSAE